MARRRIPFPVRLFAFMASQPEHSTVVQAHPDARADIIRPARYRANQAIQLRNSNEGQAPYTRLTQAVISRDLRGKTPYWQVGARFSDLGPAAEGFAFGMPPMGNIPDNFKQRPPRKLNALLPQGGALWTPPTYGEDYHGA